MPPARTASARALTLLLAALLIAAVVAVVWAQRQRQAQHTHAAALGGGDPARGRVLMAQYGCGGCHVIPGVAGARGQVGPSLAGVAARRYIGGVAVNTPEALAHWIRNPPALSPGTAMPRTGVTEAESRDIASYLYTLR